MLELMPFTPLEERIALIEKELTSLKLNLTPGNNTYPVRIATLSNQEPTPSLESILMSMGAMNEAITADSIDFQALGYKNYQSLDEASWMRLVSIFDRYTLENPANTLNAQSPQALLYKIIAKLALDEAVEAQTRINAYLFLRSQQQHAGSPAGNLFLKFAEFVISETEDLPVIAVLLLDSYFPVNGLASIDDRIQQHLIALSSSLIDWAKASTTQENFDSLLQRLSHLKSEEIVLQFIGLALTNEYPLEAACNLFTTMELVYSSNETLFNLFFLKQMLERFPNSFEETIENALENFDTVQELENSEMAEKVFAAFVVPVLKQHPAYLLSTGNIVLAKHPELLNAFSALIPEMPFSNESFQFMMTVANRISPEILRKIFSIATTAADYSGMENSINSLLYISDFEIQTYYTSASSAFKKLPDVVIYMQLSCFEQNIFNEEAHRHVSELHAQYEPSAEIYATNPRFLGSRLAYQIVENDRINKPEGMWNQTARAARKSITTFAKGHLVNGKDAKTPFLRNVLQRLMYDGEFSSQNTNYPNAPFIWSVYVEAYLPVKAKMKLEKYNKGNGEVLEEEKNFTPEKISEVNTWLKEQILEVSNAPETQTLLTLPLDLRKALFGFEGSEINPETLDTLVIARRRSLPFFSELLSRRGSQNAGVTNSIPTFSASSNSSGGN